MTKIHIQKPIDKIAIASILSLGLVICLLVWGSKACEANQCFIHVGPRVQDFSWSGKQIGAEDAAFILTFDRPMDEESVAENLVINPPLPGKISWAGRRLAYTLTTPAPYGENYELRLRDAREKIRGDKDKNQGKVIEPFTSQFSSRDRAFVYIGAEGEEQGRLVLFNLTEQRHKILTPKNLKVIDFEIYPQGDRILFSATKPNQSSANNQLYTVTTGLNFDSEPTANNDRESVKLIFKRKSYQNLNFDLSPNGKTIVIRRANRKNLGEFGLWKLEENGNLEALNNPPGGDFLITPDSQSLALAIGEGIAILPLEPNAEPIAFLSQFGRVVTFSRNGYFSAMINYNRDNPELAYNKSLFLVYTRGGEEKLFDTNGSILDCKFNPTATKLYCLLTQLIEEAEEYREQPYFAGIDLKTKEILPLLVLPEYQDLKISMASDGLGILFDQAIVEGNGGSRIWLLIPPSSSESNKPQLEQLPLAGSRPQWLP